MEVDMLVDTQEKQGEEEEKKNTTKNRDFTSREVRHGRSVR